MTMGGAKSYPDKSSKEVPPGGDSTRAEEDEDKEKMGKKKKKTKKSEVEGKFIRVWGNSGGVVLEGAHGELARKKCTTDKGGGNWGGGGGTSYLCGILTPGAEDSDMPGDRLSGSST